MLLKFTTFLGQHRPDSVPVLIYYLDALKALAAIKYANAVAEALEPLEKHDFTSSLAPKTANEKLEEKAREAFMVLTREDLPAYVTYVWVNVVSTSIRKRITGTMPPHLRDASEGLAEVFCLTDPSREDNPIVFASEEFHRTTQYGVNYAIGRNCRFLQGPRTDPHSVRRLREAIAAGRDTCETFVNYRRDGSPFMNLLMTAPLRDSRGNLRYFIGAQVDVSGLAKECTELGAMQQSLGDKADPQYHGEKKGEFEELSEMFNQTELEIVRKSGGALHQEHVEEDDSSSTTWHRPRLLLKDPSAEDTLKEYTTAVNGFRPQSNLHGRLIGVYQHYLLVRPFPSLRILFASPSLRVPGILQSPFMNRIGSSERVRDELVSALADGRGVTAKIRWVSKHEDEGRNRWIHCTPLLGSNGQVGVWMIVLVDDDQSRPVRRFREAPPVAQTIGSRTQDSAVEPGQYARTATMGSASDYAI